MTHTDPIKALVGLEAELRILDAHIDKKFAHWTSLYGDRFSEIGNKAAENAYHEAVHAFAVASNRKTILAAIEALKPMADMVMVPREPTPEMIKAGLEVKWLPDVKFGPRVADIYKAMLAAAPPASPAPVDESVVENRVRMLEGTLNYIRTQAKANHPGVLEVIIANVNTALDGKHLESVRSAALAAINGEK